MKASAKDELFKYLVAYNTKHGCLPTQQEIAADLGRNRSTISRHMQKLANQGKLKIKYHFVHYYLT